MSDRHTGDSAAVDRPLSILSLGAGRQSSTLLRMSIRGDLPRIDAAVFADTQREPRSVYRHLWRLAKECHEAGIPLIVGTAGDLGEVALSVDTRSGSIPVFIENEDGSQGRMRRDCTVDFKIAVIRRITRQLWLDWKRRTGRKDPVQQWIGMSWDEMERMRPSPVKYVENVYPLIDHHLAWNGDRHVVRARRPHEAGISSGDCLLWHLTIGYPKPPRSSCNFCPAHKDAEWRRLRDEEPDEFAEAVQFERDLQAAHAASDSKWSFRGTPYLHRSMVPLDQVDLRTRQERERDAGISSLWDGPAWDDEDTSDGCGVVCEAEAIA